MKHIDLSKVFFGAEPLNDLLLEPSVLVVYRPNVLQHGADQLFLTPAGKSVEEIILGAVRERHIPAEVAAFGSAFLSGGDVVPREYWGSVRPKADRVLFLAVVPEGGDDLFGIIAGLAVATFAIALSGGALATLAPAIFGWAVGTAGQVAGLLVAPGGSVSLNTVVRP